MSQIWLCVDTLLCETQHEPNTETTRRDMISRSLPLTLFETRHEPNTETTRDKISRSLPLTLSEHWQVTPRLTKLSLNSKSAKNQTLTSLSAVSQYTPNITYTHGDLFKMTKPPLKTETGGCDVRMRITSTSFGNRYVIKVSHNAEVPLKIKTGPMVGSGQGLNTLEPGKTWRYEFGALEHRPQVNDFVDEVTFAFEDGRDVALYHEIPCWTAFALQRGSFGHKRKISIQ